jgi:ATP-dependent Zn protease
MIMAEEGDEKNYETQIAYHEAGHVVAAHVLGLEVRGISIVSDEVHAGLANVPVALEHTLVYDDEDYDYMFRQLVVYFSGAVADELLSGASVEFTPDTVYINDWIGAASCVEELVGDDLEKQGEVSEQARDKSRQILRENWPKVKKLAESLLEHRELSAKQVEDLLR